MSFLNKIKAGLRTAAASTRSRPGWERDWAMIKYSESSLPRAVERGLLPKETLDYAMEIIELKIQGKIVAKTRYQWAQWENSQSPFPRYPYRSYDSDKTRAINTQAALLDLVSLNKAHPELSLDELHRLIQEKYFWGYTPLGVDRDI